MENTRYWALRVHENRDGNFGCGIEKLQIKDLPAGEVLIKVSQSALNYKDAMSISGHKGVTSHYPHTPGIDAAGVVAESSHGDFAPGAEVIVTGYDLGMNTPGGLGQYIRVPGDWVVPMPEGLDATESMILGTAGLTAGLAIERLQQLGMKPGAKVLVTGSSGGVGSISVLLLAHLGYEVTASTGSKASHDFLQKLGASSVIERSELAAGNFKAMLKARWNYGIDSVGGDTLGNILKSLDADGAVACCGLVQSPKLSLDIYPFILRGVSLLGIDSAQAPMALRRRIWQNLATDWKPQKITLNHLIYQTISLKEVPVSAQELINGTSQGRILVAHEDE